MLLRLVLPCVIVASVACGVAIDATVRDAAITAAVQTALLNDPGIDGTAIEVRTQAGVVYLAGTVATADEAARAVSLARAVDQVLDVQSSIGVDPSRISPTPRS